MMLKKEKSNKQLFITSIFFSCLILFILPKLKYNVTSFSDRIMGNGMMNGIDITKRINSVYLICIIIIPILAILINKILNKLLKNAKPTIIKYLNIISVLGIINILMEFINIINGSNTVIHSSYILFGINLIIIICTSIRNKKNISLSVLKWSFMASIPFAFFATLIMHKLNIVIKNEAINWFLCYFAGIIIILFITKLLKINKQVLRKSYTFFLLAPLFEYIYLELYNILNQYNIILTHKTITICMIYIICFVITVTHYIINRHQKIKFNYTKYYYPIIILIFTFIASSIQMVNQINSDFFESANHGLGIYEFFRYGKIPVIETFDAHIMNNQMYGIIYGILNHDVNGAVFCLYKSYSIVIVYLVLYIFFKKLFKKDIAFLITMFFPLACDGGLNNYCIGLLAVIALINVYQKKDKKSFTIFWLSLIFLCLYKLDIGFSASIATVVILVYIYIKNRKTIKLRNALIPLGIIILLFLTLFFGICLVKDINPIMRLIEFIKISMSNINWGYSTLGNKQTFAYPFVYYIMPIIVISTLIYTIYSQRGKVNNRNIILLFLALFYILNIQRGMVRHSLAENNIGCILSFSLLYLSIFIMNNYRNVNKFLITYGILIVFSGLLITPNTSAYSNLFSNSINKRIQFKQHTEIYNEKVDRIKLSDSMIDEYKDLKTVLEQILDEDETYLDMSNQNLLYALIGKEKPVYVNQSPGLLSGELTQQMYINEVKNCKKEIPVILKATDKICASSIDGIENDYRYYLLSEFRFNKYEFVAKINNYEIWIDKQVLEEKKNKLQELNLSNLEIIDINDYLVSNTVNMKIGEIPLIWGEYDKNEKSGKTIGDNISLEKEKSIELPLNVEKLEKENGNYIKLEISSQKETILKLALYSEENLMGEYDFNIEKGTHTYVIRTSTMYSWYEGNINKLVINSNDELEINNIEILEADTIKQL